MNTISNLSVGRFSSSGLSKNFLSFKTFSESTFLVFRPQYALKAFSKMISRYMSLDTVVLIAWIDTIFYDFNSNEFDL